jgi:hypothetical protein
MTALLIRKGRSLVFHPFDADGILLAECRPDLGCEVQIFRRASLPPGLFARALWEGEAPAEQSAIPSWMGRGPVEPVARLGRSLALPESSTAARGSNTPDVGWLYVSGQ